MEPVGAQGGVRFVNDSKATNIDAAARSIESFDRVVAIVGGKFKGGRLRGPRRHRCARTGAPWSRSAKRGRWCARRWPASCRSVEAGTLADAVRRAWDLAVPDGVVLLAPACSSFDMFVDYADRGRRFKEEVRRLVTRGEA